MVSTLWSQCERDGTVKSTMQETVVELEAKGDQVSPRRRVVYEFNHHHHRALKLYASHAGRHILCQTNLAL